MTAITAESVSNTNAKRYRLTEDEIMACCENGYELGFRTFVLQGGEDAYYTDDRMVAIKKIKEAYPECALTLSIGERSLVNSRDFGKLEQTGICFAMKRRIGALPEATSGKDEPCRS